MRIVFMGTPVFSAHILRRLITTHEVVGVVTRPDAVSGRGRSLRPSPVKELALEAGIEVLTPRTLRDAEVVSSLAALHPDCIVVAAFGAILPPAVLAIPPLGCINVHASLLPRWRGAAPVQRAILAGDAECGVCIMRMEEGLDTGDFCRVASLPVDHMDVAAITDRLAHLGADELVAALDDIASGSVVWTAQDADLATYADKVVKSDTLLDPALGVVVCDRRVRAASDAAPARALVCGKPVRIMSARPAPEVHVGSGQALLEDGGALLLGCSDGAIEVLELKPDGKGTMPAAAWVRGLHAVDGSWGAL